MNKQEVKTIHQEDPQVVLDRLAAQYLTGEIELDEHNEQADRVAPALIKACKRLSGVARLEP